MATEDGLFFEDVAVGAELPPVVQIPTYLDLVVYAGASRDFF